MRIAPTAPAGIAVRPDWALALDQAIVCGTRESAWAARLEHRTGMLRTGLAADLVVLALGMVRLVFRCGQR